MGRCVLEVAAVTSRVDGFEIPRCRRICPAWLRILLAIVGQVLSLEIYRAGLHVQAVCIIHNSVIC